MNAPTFSFSSRPFAMLATSAWGFLRCTPSISPLTPFMMSMSQSVRVSEGKLLAKGRSRDRADQLTQEEKERKRTRREFCDIFAQGSRANPRLRNPSLERAEPC